ncbi:hypothetical protein [Undibacterium sp. SXout20W]|uniref:hypothetical protein n=1 Tax=Undibacterium sp. SXout20W TaxID=3413051 RepID=UPI003BF32AE6
MYIFNHQSARRLYPLIFVCASFFFTTACIAEQRQDNDIAKQGDPQRWYQEKDTPEAYFATLKKEAYAVYQEAIVACKIVAASDKKQCIKEAKKQLVEDLAAAKNNTENFR